MQLGTKMNGLDFEIKRSEVKVSDRTRPGTPSPGPFQSSFGSVLGMQTTVIARADLSVCHV